MKLTAITVACLATGAYASMAARSLDDVNSAVSSVSQEIGNLDTAIKGFNGDAGGVKSAASKLIDALKAGTSKVSGSSALTLNDALGLQAPVQALQAKAQTLASDFHTAKPAIQKAGQCGTVRQNLGDISINSQNLIDAVVKQVPTAAQPIAQNLASGLTKVLSQASDDFSESNCVDSGSSSSAAGSSSTAATSGAATSGAATSGAATSGAATSGAATSGAATSATGSGVVVPTGGATTATYPVGTGSPTGTHTMSPPVVTAGAALFAPAGALALALAAAIL